MMNNALLLKTISNVRIIQKNLIYVIGIPHKYGSEWTLRSKNFFGQFGEIKKVVFSRKMNVSEETTISAYITFNTAQQAQEAIAEVDETILDNRKIKCTYGTTKYCTFYIRKLTCLNPQCMYLHSVGRKEDIITRDEMYFIRHKLHSFDIRNKRKEILGKERDNLLFHLLFKYKPEKILFSNEKVRFKPIDYI